MDIRERVEAQVVTMLAHAMSGKVINAEHSTLTYSVSCRVDEKTKDIHIIVRLKAVSG